MIRSEDMPTLNDLKVDQAIIEFHNFIPNAAISVESRLEECNNCLYMKKFDKIEFGQSAAAIVTTRYENLFRINSTSLSGVSTVCKDFKGPLVELVKYDFNVTQSDCALFASSTIPNSHLLPLGIAIVIYAVAIAAILVAGTVWNSWRKNHQQNNDQLDMEEQSASTSHEHRGKFYGHSGDHPSPSSEYDPNEPISESNPIGTTDGIVDVRAQARRRIQSLDALRGLTILLMIFVNYKGGGYSFFEHKPWYGITVADLVFPSFVFIMGFSIVLSIKAQLTLKKDFLLVIINVLKRSAKIFFIGFVLNTDFTDMSKVRVTGVLQRFSISYLVVALTHLTSIYRSNKYQSSNENLPWAQLIMIFLPEFLVHCLMLFVYLFFTFIGLKGYVEHCPEGYQGPGGLEDGGRHYDCTGGMARYIDLHVFGNEHMYQTPTSQELYESRVAHDPEGFLGYTTSILLTEIGLICGRVLLKVRPHHKRITIWFIIAVVCALFALGLYTSEAIPVVKNLWSLSYILVSAAITIVTFILMYLLIDVLNAWPHGVPFHWAGMNAILLYIGHIVFGPYFPFFYQVNEASHAWLLFRSLGATTIWLLIAAYFYYKKWFVTL